MFVIGKLNLMSISLCLDTFHDQRNVATYTTYLKCILGLEGWGGEGEDKVVQAEEDIKQLTKYYAL